MKANAPEKIYIPTAGDELHYHMTCPNNEFQKSIEYIRKDAFIEKACEWLECNNTLHDGEVSDYIEEFKKAMML